MNTEVSLPDRLVFMDPGQARDDEPSSGHPAAIAPNPPLPYIAPNGAPRGDTPMALALIQILLILLTVAWWIIVIQMILSWLVAFNVINTHNDFVRGLMRGLDRILEPIYRPIRKVLPDFGGLDFSPMVVIILLIILRKVVEGVGRDLL